MDEVLRRHGLTRANANGAGQVVAAGTLEQLAALAADPPARARIIPLQVAGAFHTSHMAPAVAVLRDHAAGLAPRDPRIPLLSNADGTAVASGTDMLTRLVVQVSNPVRWDLCMQTMLAMGVTAEARTPAGGHSGQSGQTRDAGGGDPGGAHPGDLEPARELIARHLAPPTHRPGIRGEPPDPSGPAHARNPQRRFLSARTGRGQPRGVSTDRLHRRVVRERSGIVTRHWRERDESVVDWPPGPVPRRGNGPG